MTQQQAMELILKEWVRINHNVEVLAKMALPTTYNSQVTERNGLERILKSHGFIYRIITECIIGEYKVTYIFRKKRAVKINKVLLNWVNKHIGQEWLTIEINLVEM